MGNNKQKKGNSVQNPPRNQIPFDSKIVKELKDISSDLENVNNRLESLNEKKSFSTKEFILSVLIAVIATILSSFIISFTSNLMEQSNSKKSIFDAAENICIGCSKEWMDSKFGVPNFSYAHTHTVKYEEYTAEEQILECCYILDEIIIRAFYKSPADSCCLFLVTQRTQKMSYELHIPYSPTNGKPLGKFTYAEIEGNPQSILAVEQQGFIRDLYGEFYNFGTSTNYYQFVFMTLDYGYIDPNFDIEECAKGTNRDSVYPNTYGIAASNLPQEEIRGLVRNYYTFDSFWPFSEEKLTCRQLNRLNKISIS